jgi:hypothetical protein
MAQTQTAMQTRFSSSTSGYNVPAAIFLLVGLAEKYGVCGENRACSVIPVPERPVTDFLWQRSPFMLQGWGVGTIEIAANDYVLSYWMARYYGVL